MKRKMYFTSLCVGLFLFMAGLLNVPAQNTVSEQNVYRHTVQAGETLYHLAQAYGVTQEQIQALNPGLTAQSLKAGAEILIPVSNKEGNRAAIDGRIEHKVQKKETLWSISQKYGITVEDLVAANPQMEEAGYQLKKGEVIYIPNVRHAGGENAEQAQAVGYEQLRLAVILPLKAQGAEAKRSVEFYRGFLMAAEDLKGKGLDITISAVNEPAGNLRLDSTLSALKRRGVQLIVGPLYPSHFDETAKFCAANDIKCAIPFSSKVSQIENTPEMFLLNAPEAKKTQLATHLFRNVFNANSTKVVLLPGIDNNEQAFASGLKAGLLQHGYAVTEMPPQSTVAQMAAQLDSKKTTLFVPMGSTRANAINILNQMTELRKSVPQANAALFAYPEWLEIVNEYQNDFFAANTYFFTNAFYNPYDAGTQGFEQRYKTWFNEPLQNIYPRLALLGYDAGRYLMEGLSQYGENFGGQTVTVNGLQSRIHFEHTTSSRGGYVNGCMQFIHYGPDRTIEKLAFQ